MGVGIKVLTTCIGLRLSWRKPVLEHFFSIDHHNVKDKIRFNRLFFALKPCVDGFIRGCRPYFAVDSTFLTGRFRGQLCIACAVDGHNWTYPVAVGVIDSETNENWK
jgi:hypothetical protein